jgi:hypothetical protein
MPATDHGRAARASSAKGPRTHSCPLSRFCLDSTGGHGARLLASDDGKKTSGLVPTIGVKMKEPRRGEALGVRKQPGDEQRTVTCE